MSPQLEEKIEGVLKNLGWWNRWSEMANSVLEVSDLFNSQKGTTPWTKPSHQAAYLAYFLPLNSARSSAVFYELIKLKFPLSKKAFDFGSGPGTCQLSWTGPQFQSWQNLEISPAAQKLHTNLSSENPIFTKAIPPLEGYTLFASYALNELRSHVPDDFFRADQLVLIEPSLQDLSRNLMELRAQLIKKGFSIWAPCTHQDDCPLLTKSSRDWCHDRIHFSPPSWWSELQRFLPMKNDTLTFSYLLASRKAPPWKSNSERTRVIGDTLFERGKVRQAICRSSQREFLSWLTKKGSPQLIPHGSLIEIPNDIEVKANELRPENELKII